MWPLGALTLPVCRSVSRHKLLSPAECRFSEQKKNYFAVINITLPDEKSNYVHRIGRVGRAERMGLAISLVSSVPEKVWYHGEWCGSRGRNCWNTNLTTQKGCCVWLNEKTVSSICESYRSKHFSIYRFSHSCS